MLQSELRSALLHRDTLRTRALRGLIAAIDNAEAVTTPPNEDSPSELAAAGYARVVVAGDGPTEVQRRHLSEDQVAAILRREVEAAFAAASELRACGALERAAEIEAEALLAASYFKYAGTPSAE